MGLTPEEKKLYTQLFKSLDPENTGVVTGEKARTTFEKSGLPPSILGEIWQISDLNNLGFLNQFGFCYAMRLIGYTQSGQHPVPGLADVPGPLPKFVNLSLPQQNILQLQSTNSSFMSSQPNASIPQSAASQDSFAAVSPNDYQKFSRLFIKTVGSAQGDLDGSRAKDIFLKAKLPTTTLGQIWSLVDRYNTGKLNVGGFVIAMYLIQGLLSGHIKQLPPFLPESIWKSVEQPQQQLHPAIAAQNTLQSRQVSHSSINSQLTAIRHPTTRDISSTSEWIVTPAMKQQYESIFNNLDKEKKGRLNPDQVASFLMTSKLNQQDLALIWDLADIQNSGFFSKLEFSVALFLVNRKIAGKPLPNVVPDELLVSLKQEPVASHSSTVGSNSLESQPQPQHQQQQRQVSDIQNSSVPVQSQSIAKSKSSIDDLVDIFGSSDAAASNTPTSAPQVKPELVQRASSSDLSHAEVPRIRNTLTGSFKPTSSFGQSLMQQQETRHQSLSSNLASPVEEKKQVQSLSTGERAVSPQPQQQQKSVNYEALRSVPPPPPPPSQTQPSIQRRDSAPVPGAVSSPNPYTPSSQQPSGERSLSQRAPSSSNDDLLADPAISGQLSQATSDIANVSNQIKSLTSQTTNLHEKKTRAEKELQRILITKSEIENKLKQLRASYDNEVKQVEQVEANLATAKEEIEALRSEASIAEAKVNSLSGELHEKQVAMESLQKENSTLKEKLGSLNAEIVELEKQAASKSQETHALSNQVAVKKSQVQVAIVKSEELKSKIAEIEASHKQLQLDLDNAERERLDSENRAKELHAKSVELEQNKPTKPSAGITATIGAAAVGAAAVVGGGVASVVHHLSAGSTESSDSGSRNDPVERSVKEETESDNDVEETNARFPQLQVSEPADNATNTTSSNITDRATDDEETPITSPSNSDFQFPQGNNAAIVGGMVGMPGVLVGVQRTESLTSSVQNNAALSVRDDNIDEISDRETLENADSSEETAPNTANTGSFDSAERQHLEGSDKGSSSFEIVNAEEARSPEHGSDEFPPIRELDYQESDSSDDGEDQTFDDAVDSLQKQEKLYQGSSTVGREVDSAPSERAQSTRDSNFDDFDFDNLQPAAPETETNEKDFFNDEFTNLEAANVDNAGDEEFGQENDEFGELSEDFTNSNAPDFSRPEESSTAPLEGNDEWEQLFAGFGNSQPQQEEQSMGDIPASGSARVSEPPSSVSAPLTRDPPRYESPPTAQPTRTSSNEYAIQELVGMGFDENTAIEALKKEDWNLEAATNYLLDTA